MLCGIAVHPGKPEADPPGKETEAESTDPGKPCSPAGRSVGRFGSAMAKQDLGNDLEEVANL